MKIEYKTLKLQDLKESEMNPEKMDKNTFNGMVLLDQQKKFVNNYYKMKRLKVKDIILKEREVPVYEWY
jgi:hypothetical protein